MEAIQRSLIIDDETDICQLLGYILSRRNIEIDYATNLNDSKRILNKKAFNFVFLDNYLPDGTGLDFIPYLKKTFPGLKIIMITASANVSYETVHRVGIDWLLPKPLHTESINEVIDHLLTTHPQFISRQGTMKRFSITFYLNQKKVIANVKKSVIGTRTDYIVRPDSAEISHRFGKEITLFKEDDNFSVNTSSDGAFNDYVNAVANAIRPQD